MLLENQNPDEAIGENENYLESSSQIELPAKSLTELEQEYYETITIE
jgi:hypothetical protein